MKAVGLVVECCGVPGSGKSTVTAALVELVGRHGVPVHAANLAHGPQVSLSRRGLRKAVVVVRETVRAPWTVGSIALALASSRQRRPRDAAAYLINWIVYRGDVRVARSRPGITVFDQGAIALLWSTNYGGDVSRCRKVLGTRAWTAAWPDVVIWCDIDPVAACDHLRRRGRPQSRLEALEDRHLVDALATANGELMALLKDWRAHARPDERTSLLSVTNPGDDSWSGELDRLAGSIVELAPQTS